MKLFVAGGTGAIGKQLVPQLVDAGHEVVATTRSANGAEAVQELGAEPAIVDGLDEGQVADAVRRAQPEVVIHEMTALAGKADLRHFDRMFARTNELRTKGTDNLIHAAREAGARRVIVQSYAGWPTIREGGRVKTEVDPLDPNPPKWMRESMAGHLQRRRRRSGAGPGMDPVPGRGDRRKAAAAGTGVARSDRRGRGPGDDDDQRPRLLEREGKAGAGLAAALSELARGLCRRGRRARGPGSGHRVEDVVAAGSTATSGPQTEPSNPTPSASQVPLS